MIEFQKGDKVMLARKHPWGGNVAEFVEYRKILLGMRPVFRIIPDGNEVFVMKQEHIQTTVSGKQK